MLHADTQVLEETLHCIPDHVLDAPPRQLEAWQHPIAGLTDNMDLPASVWASTVSPTSPATALRHPDEHAAEQEDVAAVEALPMERTRAVAVMA